MGKLIFGYVKLFLIHILRSLLVSILVTLAAGLLSLLIAFLGDLLLNDLFGVLEVFTIPGVMIIDTAISLAGGWLIVGGIGISNGIGFDRDGRAFGKTVARSRYPHIAVLVIQLLVLFIVLGVGSGLLGWLGYDEFVELEASDNYLCFLALVFPATAVAQLFYFGFACAAYRGARCVKCKRLYSIESTPTGSSSWDEYGYVETTTRENVGSLEAGGQKVNVYANVTRGRNTKTHTVKTTYHCRCQKCGREFTSERYSSSTTDI